MIHVKDKFTKLIRKLQYSSISLGNINVNALIPWMRQHMPLVVDQLEPLGWDLTDDDTWLETMFISTIVNWYGNKVAVFITDSFLDYKISRQLLTSNIIKKFWDKFEISAHISILVDNTIFIESEDLDDLYSSIDWKNRYSFIDISGYDENDVLLPHLQRDWGFLENFPNDQGEYTDWSSINKLQLTRE